ncbi:archaeosine tRNA-ribosyltransferase [Methanohalobium evestigatum Z-7303]|uniref:tRNA-guanine(15) transglycosylase n=1 Tax=Methanohalobium evestigatum (strain ATCC BAA-1072 / DSM 3721 / NBRC 107634 / OCM 161 / Z-7303) TaxID=644295 RepID=D7EB54_METEZ|nr:tRNA guanosine(15) transglycosylase TgtA [Methanohalobium evestigatum]ADI74571.1 archaeosine tRNA-ribosyltransferase [Methanohalobium evestigatum Z-7303]
MSSIFEITQKDASGRIGKLVTRHGTIETPTIMPVINPNIPLIDIDEMKDIGAQILITNSYIIYRSEKLHDKALNEGLHELIGFDGPIMTDSGSFQLSVYGDVEITNEEIIDFQKKIGSDIAVPLDIPTPPDVSYEKASSEINTTVERLKKAREKFTDDMLLAGPVQGSTYSDLREKCAQELTELDFDVYPIGAVVPLMEDYRYSKLVDVIVSSKKGLKPSSPVHLFGAGHPMGFALEVALGCDLFDSAAYALYAKNKRYITVYGTYHLENLHYLPCSCPVCANYTAQELKSAENNVELLAKHNLYVTFEEMNLIKQSIKEGDLLELVEQRCRSHPRLLEALKTMYKYSDWLEKYNPVTKSTIFYCGPESSKRPEVLHFSKRIERFTVNGSAIIRSNSTKQDDEFDNILMFKPPLGTFPVELLETYPFNIETISSPDYESIEVALLNTIKLIEQNPEANFTFVYEYDLYHPLLDKISEMANLVRKYE